MKRLHLVRHAKSSWDEPALADHDRPLAARGQRDLAVMSRHLARQHPAPDLLLSSSALRALQTAEGLAAAWRLPACDIVVQARIYEASLATLLSLLQGLPVHCRSALLVGHNPGLSELAHHLHASLTHLPTCAVLSLELAIDSWAELAPASVLQFTLDRPKALKTPLKSGPSP
jgi:phosphohistidine phosphatase